MYAEIDTSDLIASVKQGNSLRKLAKEYNTTVHQLRKQILATGVSVRDIRPTLVSIVQENFQTWYAEKRTAEDIAKEFDVSPAYIKVVLSSCGFSLKKGVLRIVDSRTDNEFTVIMQDVVTRLVSKGGSISQVIRDLGVDHLSARIRERLKSHKIDPADYFYAHRRFHKWVVLPGPVLKGKNGAKQLSCKCTNCGAEHYVDYSNLVSGQSKGCPKCFSSSHISVVDMSTGEIHSSLRAALTELDALKTYQSARLTLMRTGSVLINDHQLQLNK